MAKDSDWWVDNLFRPLALALMAGCVATAVVKLVNAYVPYWNGLYIVLGCMLAALEGCYSYRLVRARGIRGDDLLRFRVIEFALFFILLKIGGYIGERWSDILADLRTWPRQPLNIVNLETIGAFLLTLASWWSATRTVEDLERIGEPPIPQRSYLAPSESIANRFFWGGGVLLLISGFARLAISSLLREERPPVPELVLNVLVYFLLGLAMLSQVHFTRLQRRWEAQKITIGSALAGRWVRYSLILITLATVLALLLPTGYTVGLLDVVGYLLFVLGYYISLLGLLLTMLLSFLLSPLFTLLGRSPRVLLRLPPLEDMRAREQMHAGAPLAWFELLKSFLFWAVALGLVIYVVRSYLHDRPELLRILASLKPIRALTALLEGIWLRLRGLARVSQEWLPRLSLWRARGERARTGDSLWRLVRLGRLTPHERILYYYLSIVERASGVGFPRRRSQTPYEYEQGLGPCLGEAEQDMGWLTEAFVEARYSAHAIGWTEEKPARTWWNNVKAALRRLRTGGQPAEGPSATECGPELRE
ncbi:MAG: DUF4129 domain-containing protein [Anaerolineae bacterium]|nr:DUF4129 domain-containing protein [Anaerolineae bacterium]